MPNNPLDAWVLVIAALALSLTVLSVYVSRVYLPAKIREAYRKSITTLAVAVETKDSGTVGHAQRVAHLTTELARRLGMAGKELVRIEYAALLRDIGKVKVPQRILNKTETLGDEEWATVQRHSEFGAEMVEAVPFLASSANLVRYHHEYWDGSGYPDGLAGEQIPLGSRILSVAADYDAMVSERPYHPEALGVEEALAQIRAGSGAKYDPRVVEVFIRVIEEERVPEQKAA
ncbi:MAG: hypothetical protein A2Z18_07330 [Armatimonadetes bacterium RBG_16_58_9]|nr:MAG: hypothetical protein A2Z18_07330 [Armatimonadetes bacterium RBG_16_58_9]